MAKTKVTGGYIADSAITSDHLHTTLDLSTKTLTIGAATVSGHLIPSANITYDLGSSTNRFRDIYLDGTTINLGGTELKKNDAGDIEFKSGSNFKRLVVSELEFDDGTNRKKFKIDSGRIKSFDSSGVSDTADKISLSSNTTDDLGEGSSNLYFTTARADARISAASIGDLSDIDISGVTAGQALTWSASNNRFEPTTLGSSTDSFAEGSSNLYFTTARAREAISVSGNALSYNSSTGVLTANYEESPSFTGNVTVSGTINSGAYAVGATTVIDANKNVVNLNAVGIGTATVDSGYLLHLKSTGDAAILIEADSDNVTETDNAFIRFSQDGGLVATRVGYTSGGNSFEIMNEYNDSLILGQANTPRLTLTSASATFAGTISSGAITSTGAIQGASFSDGTISGITFIDEDSFSTNSATRVPTQQSIKAYVDAQVAGVVDTAPAALDTLNELAAALGDDANFSTTTSTALGNRLRVDTAAQGLTGTQQANAITNLGITATKAELNYVDGVTSNIQTQLNGKQASGSYLTGNQTITLSGDVSGSGTTSISVTVADDSHNHIISNVDGLQTALDGKLGTTDVAANSQLLDSLDSTAFLRSNADDTMSEKLTFSQSGSTEFMETPGTVKWHSNGAGFLILKGLGQLRFEDDQNWDYNSWGGLKFDSSADIMYIGGPAASQFTSNANPPSIDVDFVGLNASGLKKDGNVVWHAGNDGSGSGLDADLLDGQHASAFLTGNQTITLSGDVSGSGTTSIAVTIADDSHNHVISNVDGLQTALDGKLALSGGTITGNLTLSYAYPRINLTDTNHDSDYSIINNDGAFSIYDVTNSSHRLSINSSGNATFAGQIHFSGSSSLRSNNIITFNTLAGAAQTGYFKSVAAQTSYANGVSDGMFNALNGYAVGTGTGQTVIDASRNLTNIGTISSGAITSSGNIDANGKFIIQGSGTLLEFNNSGWNAGNQTHDILYNGWTSATGDYIYLSAAGNSNTDCGTLLVTDGAGFYYGTHSSQGGITSSGTDPLSNVKFRVDASGNITEAGAITSTVVNTGDATLLTLHHDTGPDLATQQSFIDFSFEDDNTNETPQVRIGAQVGQNADANTQEKEGSGAFVVYTNNANTTAGAAGTSLAERMRVDYQGYVGINTTTPTELLHVDGTIKANNLKLASLSAQNSEATSIMIDGSGVIGTRELGSNAFNSTSYLTGNQTITLSGDVSGSGTTSIAVTVADDSHNHIISNVDGLQTALNAKLASSSYTAADVLTKIKTVDGSGSGLDADLLDGIQASQFIRNDTGSVPIARFPTTALYGDDSLGAFASSTFAVNPPRMGFFNINNSSAENPTGFGYWQGLHFRHNNQSSTWGWQLAGTYNATYADLYFRQVASASRGSWYKLWHTGNDGSGSGLDADLLDGQHGSYYLNYNNFTNTPTIPSLSGYATETYVNTQVSNLVDSAPGTLDTLNELAAALGDDANFSTTVTNSIATKAPIASPSFTTKITTPQIHHTSTISVLNGSSAQGMKVASLYVGTSYNNSAASGQVNTLNGYRVGGVEVINSSGNWIGGGNISEFTNNSGYITGNQTITLSGDVSGSGTTSIAVTVADDSHNHIISNVDGLQTALDGKLSTTGTAANSQLLDSIDSTGFLRSNANDTLSSTLKVTGSIIHEYNTSGGYIARPKGAQYVTTTGTVTGAIKIKLPTHGTDDMLSFWVDIYDYASGESVTMWIGGYLYQTTGNNEWTNETCLIFTEQTGKAPENVRFGADGSNNCIWIGETTDTWSYPQVIVRDFQCGYTADIDAYDDNWAISFVTSFDTVDTTRAAKGPVTEWDRVEGKPTIPTNNNQLTNGAGYTTNLGFSRYNANTTYSTYSNRQIFYSNTNMATSSSYQASLEVFASGVGNDAFMSFHVGSDYAIYLGLDGGTNKLSVGGWSMGANSYEIYHSGNKPSLATLGYTGASNANYITNNNQLTNGAGYITASNGAITNKLPLAGGTMTGNLNLSGSTNHVIIGGSTSNNAYNTVGSTTGLTFGGGNDFNNYSIGTSTQNIDGNYTKLNIKWHTGIRFFAMNRYGGVRFHSDVGMGTELMSIGNTDGHVRVANNLYANGGNLVFNVSNDGSGSGLDADLLDGQQGSYYATASHGHTGLAVSSWGGIKSSTSSGYIEFGPANTTWGHIYTDRPNFYFNKQLYVLGNQVWNAGNDGSGSGLDADTVDGIQGGSFLRSDATDTCSGLITFTQDISVGSQTGTWITSNVMSDAIGWNTGYGVYIGSDIGGTHYLRGNGTFTTGGNTYNLWHTGNDGSGSGLDADLLDGINSSQFLRSDANDVMTGELNITSNTGVTGSSAPSYSNAKLEVQTSSNHVPAIAFHRGGYSATALYEYDGELYTNAWIARAQTGKLVSSGNIGSYAWTSSNDGSGSGLDADLLDGLQLHTGRNNEANKVVRTDGNGYIQAGWINTTSGDRGTTAPDRIYASNDAYLRYYTPTNFRNVLGLWWSGNDGSGSGLDADLLDGYNAEEGAVNNSIVKRDGTASIKAYGLSLLRANTARTGITWYNEAYYNWQDYMAAAGATGCGPNGNLTAPTGLAGVTSWALRSRMEGVASYGWNWETGGSAGGGATATSKMSLQAVSGNLQIAGSFTAGGNVTAYSDKKLKDDVKVIENAVEKIKQVRGVTFIRNDIEDNKRQAGVIAQEVEKVLPEVVGYDEDRDTKTVAYGNMVGLLIEAIKEQQETIEKLTRRLDDIEKRRINMAITYNIANAYTGTRVQSSPDPENEGETIETTIDVTDVEVTFTDDSYTPNKEHTRMVNVCFDSDGAYDDAATLIRVGEVMAGVEHKMALGVIS